MAPNLSRNLRPAGLGVAVENPGVQIREQCTRGRLPRFTRKQSGQRSAIERVACQEFERREACGGERRDQPAQGLLAFAKALQPTAQPGGRRIPGGQGPDGCGGRQFAAAQGLRQPERKQRAQPASASPSETQPSPAAGRTWRRNCATRNGPLSLAAANTLDHRRTLDQLLLEALSGLATPISQVLRMPDYSDGGDVARQRNKPEPGPPVARLDQQRRTGIWPAGQIGVLVVPPDRQLLWRRFRIAHRRLLGRQCFGRQCFTARGVDDHPAEYFLAAAVVVLQADAGRTAPLGEQAHWAGVLAPLRTGAGSMLPEQLVEPRSIHLPGTGKCGRRIRAVGKSLARLARGADELQAMAGNETGLRQFFREAQTVERAAAQRNERCAARRPAAALRSTSRVRKPAPATRAATMEPAGPPPSTMQSTAGFMLRLKSVG